MLMEYELINPSDPYTFLTDEREVAALVVFLLSNAYGAETKEREENENIPIFLFGGAEEWYKNTFGRTPDEDLEKNRIKVAQSLESFMLGNFEDRRRYNSALECITEDDKREKFMKEWQDGRTSMNDIGSYAHSLSKKLRGISDDY